MGTKGACWTDGRQKGEQIKGKDRRTGVSSNVSLRQWTLRSSVWEAVAMHLRVHTPTSCGDVPFVIINRSSRGGGVCRRGRLERMCGSTWQAFYYGFMICIGFKIIHELLVCFFL